MTEPFGGRETTSNDQGYYVLPSLRPSTYSLTIDVKGFATAIRKGITLQADATITVNQTVELQRATESVSVEAEGLQVNTATAVASEVVDQRRVTELPLNGRNAASLLLVVAGAIPAPSTDADQGNTKTFPSAVTVSTNGARQNQVSFRLDGANNNDLYTNVNQPFPFPDALQEFSVQTANYSAKYGGNAGGVVNVVTKSGTNGFHGDLFEFNRNAVFNARNFFAAKRDQLKRNQYGGTVGGPIRIPGVVDRRNKDFFFFGYQGTKIRNLGQHHQRIGTDRANYLGGNPYGPGACTSVNCVNWLVPSGFGLPAIGTYGSVGKGFLRGPNLIGWDASVSKEFVVNEHARFQFRGEFFNALNRVNFSNPNVTQSAGGFGSITSSGDPRIGQLALKFLF